MSELHPAGTFEAKILDHGFSKSTGGTDTFTVLFETQHSRLNGYFYLTDKAAEFTLRRISDMGFTGTDLSVLGAEPLLVGNSVVISVKHDTYEGTVRAKVDDVRPVGWQPGIKKDAAAAANIKRFNALFAKVRAASDKEEIPF